LIDLKDFAICFNVEGLLETIQGTFSKAIKDEIEAMGSPKGSTT
jgi:hypothetical protein